MRGEEAKLFYNRYIRQLINYSKKLGNNGKTRFHSYRVLLGT